MSGVVYACSTNRGKLAEFALAAGKPARWRVEPLPGLRDLEAPEEDGATFEENAALKARYYSAFSSERVFADDSGLEVDALGGEPGIYSARFAGPAATDEANNRKLLAQLADQSQRQARFVCVIALAQCGRVLATFRGVAEGEILLEPRGSGGFGYDPIFFYPPLERGFAELTSDEKFKVSHRGQAVRQMVDWLENNAGLS